MRHPPHRREPGLPRQRPAQATPIQPRPQEVTLTHRSPHPSPDVQEARHRHAEASVLARSHPLVRALLGSASGRIVAQALDMIPALCDEIDLLNAAMAIIRRRYHNLVAAARATLAAATDGEPDPLYYLRDELAATGHLPGTGIDGRDRP